MIDKADFVVIFLTGTSSTDALPYELRKKTLSYLLQNFLVAQRAMMIDLGSLAIFYAKPALPGAGRAPGHHRQGGRHRARRRPRARPPARAVSPALPVVPRCAPRARQGGLGVKNRKRAQIDHHGALRDQKILQQIA